MVLGAGIVGICVALHLQRRGFSVALVDRRAPAEETSFGNAGLIQREGVFPYSFPRQFRALVRYGLNRQIDARYHLRALPQLAPFLWRYWWHSQPSRLRRIATTYAPLIERCVVEHQGLGREAGASALFRSTGWIKAFRTVKERDLHFAQAAQWQRDFGVRFNTLDAAQLQRAEPSIAPVHVGALHWIEPVSLSDPHALALAYLQMFQERGGRLFRGDAMSLVADCRGWRLETDDGRISAAHAVVALGPWSDRLTRKLGYSLPLAVKRGYHMHYRLADGAALHHPVLDHERGYFMVPMSRGVRLTTGAEFAAMDAPRTPVQLNCAETVARTVFPLGERIDAEPWMGCRPCSPDMLPVIGPAPGRSNLWFAFGHGHHGLTLAAVTGRLLSELMNGEAPFVDPAPYAAQRLL